MEKKKRGYMYAAFLIAIVIIETMLRGFVFMKMYNWFLVEYFRLPEVNLKFSAGLMLVISFLRFKIPEKDTEITCEMILKLLVLPLFFLLYAYMIYALTK